MYPNIINRIAGMLLSARSQDLRRCEIVINASRESVRDNPNETSRRVGRRKGCAAEKFEYEIDMMEARQAELDRLECIRKEREREMVKTWGRETEEGVFDEI